MIKVRSITQKLFLFTIILLGATSLGLLIWNGSRLNDTLDFQQPEVVKLSDSEYKNELRVIGEKLVQEGLPQTFAYMEQRLQSSEAFARDCHTLMHYLGHESFHFYEEDFTTAMQQAEEACNSGYIHGVIQSFFDHNPTETSLPGDVCDLEGEWTYDKWQCAHGMGHGYTLATKRDQEAAVEKCRFLEPVSAVDSCVNGVYMEMFFLIDHTGGVARSLDDAHISLCEQAGEYKGECYIYAPTAFLEQNNNYYLEAAKTYCAQGAIDFVEVCIFGVGSQAMKDNITKPEIAVRACSQMDKNAMSSCMRGAATGLFFNTGTTDAHESRCRVFGEYYSKCTFVAKNLHDKYKF